jgi:hypothetical protein
MKETRASPLVALTATTCLENQIMPDQHEKDHWRELAELLGLPADENRPASAFSPPEVSPQKKETEPLEKAWNPPEVEPVAEAAFEPAYHEEIDAGKSQFQATSDPQPTDYEPTHAETAEAELRESDAESAPDAVDEAAHDRPRRGRRRGRRGQRGDASGREQRGSPEHALRLEDTGDRLDPAGEDNLEAASGGAPEGEGDIRDRGRTEQLPQADTFEEEVFETQDDELPEPPGEEEDDEEIDKLTDWNVPSWTELIGSLYRPER